jgi:hypothetical protein
MRSWIRVAVMVAVAPMSEAMSAATGMVMLLI